MIREYFITNYLFKIFKVNITKNYLVIKIKSYYKISKYYYSYILKYLYNIYPHSVHIIKYKQYYKIIILKYLLY